MIPQDCGNLPAISSHHWYRGLEPLKPAATGSVDTGAGEQTRPRQRRPGHKTDGITVIMHVGAA